MSRRSNITARDTTLVCVDISGKVLKRVNSYELATFVFDQWVNGAERNRLRYISLSRKGDPHAFREWCAADLVQRLADMGDIEGELLQIPGSHVIHD